MNYDYISRRVVSVDKKFRAVRALEDYHGLQEEVECAEMLYGVEESIRPLGSEQSNSDLKGLGKQVLE